MSHNSGAGQITAKACRLSVMPSTPEFTLDTRVAVRQCELMKPSVAVPSNDRAGVSSNSAA